MTPSISSVVACICLILCLFSCGRGSSSGSMSLSDADLDTIRRELAMDGYEVSLTNKRTGTVCTFNKDDALRAGKAFVEVPTGGFTEDIEWIRSNLEITVQSDDSVVVVAQFWAKPSDERGKSPACKSTGLLEMYISTKLRKALIGRRNER